jgi:hypothetical protein
MTAQLDLGLGRIRFQAPVCQPTAWRRFGEMVAVRRLVVDLRDGAGRAGAERVLRGRVGVASSSQDRDVLGGLVRGAPDLIQVPAIRAVECPNRAVGCHAWRVAGSIDVARTRCRPTCRPSQNQRFHPCQSHRLIQRSPPYHGHHPSRSVHQPPHLGDCFPLPHRQRRSHHPCRLPRQCPEGRRCPSRRPSRQHRQFPGLPRCPCCRQRHWIRPTPQCLPFHQRLQWRPSPPIRGPV